MWVSGTVTKFTQDYNCRTVTKFFCNFIHHVEKFIIGSGSFRLLFISLTSISNYLKIYGLNFFFFICVYQDSSTISVGTKFPFPEIYMYQDSSCVSIVSFPEIKIFLNNLRSLKFGNASALKSLPEEIIGNNSQLESLYIRD